MIQIIQASIKSPETYSHILKRAVMNSEDRIRDVLPVIDEIRMKGDSALRYFTEKYDGIKMDRFVYDIEELECNIESGLKNALDHAEKNIRVFHEFQKIEGKETTIDGNRLGIRYTPVESCAIYAPGGKALYPSSILMGGIPAKCAGVEKRYLFTPPQKKGISSSIVYAAKISGIQKIVLAGGAQAIAAAAYGTESIPKAEFIIGPGNQYVTAAKTYLAGLGIIGIDSPAGPSEVLIIADQTANPEWIAADLLSQAEHGEDSAAILATDSKELALQVCEEVDKALSIRTKRLDIKKKAIQNYGAALVFTSLDECVEFSNIYAPEHLEIISRYQEQLFSKIKHAGSVFLGPYSPVAMGDYISGTNHVLPTAGGCRIYSSLGTSTFLKRMTYQEISKESIQRLYPYVDTLSREEGLEEEHGNSVKIRTEKNE